MVEKRPSKKAAQEKQLAEKEVSPQSNAILTILTPAPDAGNNNPPSPLFPIQPSSSTL